MAETDWANYEQALARYFASKQGFKVRRDAKLESQAGVKRQVDVLVEYSLHGTPITIAVEAKLQKRSLTVGQFSGIKEMFRSIGADVGYIFCPSGLDSGAKTELAKSANPRIYFFDDTPEEALRKSWDEEVLPALNKLEGARTEPVPSEDLIDHVVSTLTNVQLYARFFFYNLVNPAWFPIFVERGLLARALRGQSGVSPYAAASYASQCAASDPDAFVQLCEDALDLSGWIEGELFEGATSLDLNFQEKFAEAASKWSFVGFLNTVRARDLVSNLVREGSTENGLQLHERMTRVEKPAESSSFSWSLNSPLGDHWFKEMTRELVPELAESAPQAITDYATRRLLEALMLVNPDHPEELPTWLIDSVVAEEKFSHDGPLQSLVYSARDVFTRAAVADADYCAAEIKRIISSENKALVRISVAGATAVKSFAARVVPDAVSAEWLWRDYNLLPELEALIEAAWPELSSELQQQVLERVEDLPTFDYRGDISAEDAERYRKGHVVEWLLILQRAGLSLSEHPSTKALLDEYQVETGVTQISEHVGVQIFYSDETPSEAERFGEMAAEEVLGFCVAFRPSTDAVHGATPEGVARKLRADISLRPQEYLSISPLPILPYPAYYAAVLDGLEDARREGRLASISECLTMLTTIAALPLFSDPQALAQNSFNNGTWRWVRSSAASLLEMLAQSKPGAIADQDEMVKIWTNLWPLSNKESSISGADWFTAALNSEGGQLSKALCRLAIRAARGAKESEDSADRAEYEVRRNALLALVVSELLASKEPVVRAPLGFFYTLFFIADREWAIQHRTEIFDARNDELWEAAFSCHFYMTARYVEVFESLEADYLRALKLLRGRQRKREFSWAERLGDDFGIFWHADVLKASDKRLKEFWKDSSAETRRAAVLWLNQRLTEDSWKTTWPIAKGWWELAAKNQSKHNGEESELWTCLYFFEDAPNTLLIEEVLTLLLVSIPTIPAFHFDRLLEFICPRAEREPSQFSEVVLTLSKNARFGGSHADQRDLITSMGKAWLQGDVASRARLEQARDNFLTNGLFGFMDALPPEQ